MRAIAARGFALLVAGFLAHAPVHAQTQPVTDGLGVDYQPAVLRSTDDGARIVVFERLDHVERV